MANVYDKTGRYYTCINLSIAMELVMENEDWTYTEIN